MLIMKFALSEQYFKLKLSFLTRLTAIVVVDDVHPFKLESEDLELLNHSVLITEVRTVTVTYDTVKSLSQIV